MTLKETENQNHQNIKRSKWVWREVLVRAGKARRETEYLKRCYEPFLPAWKYPTTNRAHHPTGPPKRGAGKSRSVTPNRAHDANAAAQWRNGIIIFHHLYIIIYVPIIIKKRVSAVPCTTQRAGRHIMICCAPPGAVRRARSFNTRPSPGYYSRARQMVAILATPTGHEVSLPHCRRHVVGWFMRFLHFPSPMLAAPCCCCSRSDPGASTCHSVTVPAAVRVCLHQKP